jgi:LacI family transcriptional regulator
VENAVAALGYVPSEAGRNLVTRTAKRIGIVVSDLTNPFYPHLIGPLHDALEDHGYRMMVFTERSDSQVPVEQLVDGSVDGVVLLTTDVGSVLPAELSRRGLPFVFLNRESGSGIGDSSVVDNDLGGRLAANHLTGLGHRRVAGIFGLPTTSTGRDREIGFRLALADAGIGLAPEMTRHGPFEFDTGHHALREFLVLASPPTAVFCGNDVIAIGALNAALAAGVRVPDELSLIGFDDIPMAAWEVFKLTTIGHDLEMMARSAAGLLVDRIKTKQTDPPHRIVSQPHVIERSTTASPPPQLCP